MRISDWSSDVCSSDLGCKPRVLIAPVQENAIVDDRTIFRLAVRRYRLQCGDNGHATIGSFIRAMSSSFIPSSCGATLTSVRSEEHTSELQSLMRISYAVFCLKKKKQTSQVQTICTRHSQYIC